MSTGLKILLGVLAGIAVLIGVLVAAGLWLGKSAEGMVDDARKFAANTTKQGCVTEMAARLKACDGMRCTVSIPIWGGICLEDAKGSKEEFCASVPNMKDENAFSRWQGTFCAEYGLDQQKCLMAGTIVAGHCMPATAEKAEVHGFRGQPANWRTGQIGQSRKSARANL